MPKKLRKPSSKELNREFFAEAARKGWAKKSEGEKKAVVSKASLAYWDRLSPEERSAEMKRRAVVRAENAKKKARAEARAKKKKK